MGNNFTPHATHPGQVSSQRRRRPHMNLATYDAQVRCDDELKVAVSKFKQARDRDALKTTETTQRNLAAAQIDLNGAAERARIMGSTNILTILGELAPAAPPAPIPAFAPVPAPSAAETAAGAAAVPAGTIVVGDVTLPMSDTTMAKEMATLLAGVTGPARDAMKAVLDGAEPDQVKLLKMRKLAETAPPTA